MTATATMISILAFVWGGFLLAVLAAIRKEREKSPAVGAPRAGQDPA